MLTRVVAMQNSKSALDILATYSIESSRSGANRPVQLSTPVHCEITYMTGASRRDAGFNRSVGLFAGFDALEEVAHVVDCAVLVRLLRHYRVALGDGFAIQLETGAS